MPSWLLTAIFVPLIGLLLYRRFRRTFGQQRFTPRRMIVRIVLLFVVAGVSLASMPTTTGIAAAALGAIIGGALAIFSLRHTTYEVNAQGEFYKTNGWFGLGVLALFLGRFAARMFSIYAGRAAIVAAQQGGGGGPFANNGLQKSPLTLGIFFLMALYFIVYNIGLLQKHRALRACPHVD